MMKRKKKAEDGKTMKSSGKAKGEAAKFISTMITPKDRKSLDKLSLEDTMMMAAGHFLKVRHEMSIF